MDVSSRIVAMYGADGCFLEVVREKMKPVPQFGFGVVEFVGRDLDWEDR